MLLKNTTRKVIVAALALWVLAIPAAHSQIIPGGTGTIGNSGFDAMDFYVGNSLCSSSCWNVQGSSTDSVWGGVARDPFGRQTGGWGGFVSWDQDGDGDEEPVDMDNYEIDVRLGGVVETSDGVFHVVFEIVVVHAATGEEYAIESHHETITAEQVSTAIGGGL